MLLLLLLTACNSSTATNISRSINGRDKVGGTRQQMRLTRIYNYTAPAPPLQVTLPSKHSDWALEGGVKQAGRQAIRQIIGREPIISEMDGNSKTPRGPSLITGSGAGGQLPANLITLIKH